MLEELKEQISLLEETIAELQEKRDFKALSDALENFRINIFQCWDSVIPLDKVIGLDEKKHRDGIYPYGVHEVYFGSDGFQLRYHLGNILDKRYILSKGVFMRRQKYGDLKKNEKLATEEIENGVYAYGLDLLKKRKETAENNAYWIEHFDEFQKTCLDMAQKYYQANNPDYKAELRVGCSQADPKVAPAIVVLDNGSQIGYIKIYQNGCGDFKLDSCACGCGHTEIAIKNMAELEDSIQTCCSWLS